MKIAAGHESKHKPAMSKAGDVVVDIPISTGLWIFPGREDQRCISLGMRVLSASLDSGRGKVV